MVVVTEGAGLEHTVVVEVAVPRVVVTEEYIVEVRVSYV